jgi:hypothetical protein
MKQFNVCIFNSNTKKFEPYDIIPFLIDKYNSISKLDRPRTRNEIKKFINKECKYQYWSRCEYEILLLDWPCEKTKEKIDIYDQVMMNIDIIVDLLMNELNLKYN